MRETRRRLLMLGIAAVLLSLAVTASAPAGGSKTRDRAALQAVKQRLDRDTERRISSLIRRMTLDEKLNQLTLLSDGQMKENPAEARKPVGVRLQRDRPGADQQLPARRGRELTPGHPDPVRLRHDSRLPDDLPDPARRGQQLRPGRGSGRPPHRRLRIGGGGAEADLQPDGRPLARAPLGPDRRSRRRGPLSELGHGGRAREGGAGQRLQRARTGS